jgi:ketosteroid isomerase-like protein
MVMESGASAEDLRRGKRNGFGRAALARGGAKEEPGMPARTRLLLLVACFASLVTGSALAADAPEQKAVRQRRLALARAMNTRSASAIGAFVDPSFTRKAKDGQVVSRQQAKEEFVQALAALPPGVKMMTRIEKISVRGSTAQVITTVSVNFTDPQGKRHRVRLRSGETWKKIRGRWMLVGSNELD